LPGRRAPGAQERMALATLPQDGAVLLTQLWRRFAFFPGGALSFADRDHELGLLAGELALAGGPATAPDLGEVLAHFRGQGDLFVGHRSIVSRLRCPGQAQKERGKPGE
jgi:hypothetical protein